MAIDADINSSADINIYSPEQLAELQKSAIGESAREFTLNTELILIAFVVLIIVILIAAIIIKLTKN